MSENDARLIASPVVLWEPDGTNDAHPADLSMPPANVVESPETEVVDQEPKTPETPARSETSGQSDGLPSGRAVRGEPGL